MDAIGFLRELFDELLGRSLGERQIELDQQANVRAELFDQLEFVLRAGEEQGSFVGLQDTHRVRVEREHNRRAARRLRIVARLADDTLVAEVDAVEDADGEANVVGDRRQFFECVDEVHQKMSVTQSAAKGPLRQHSQNDHHHSIK